MSFLVALKNVEPLPGCGIQVECHRILLSAAELEDFLGREYRYQGGTSLHVEVPCGTADDIVPMRVVAIHKLDIDPHTRQQLFPSKIYEVFGYTNPETPVLDLLDGMRGVDEFVVRQFECDPDFRESHPGIKVGKRSELIINDDGDCYDITYRSPEQEADVKDEYIEARRNLFSQWAGVQKKRAIP